MNTTLKRVDPRKAAENMWVVMIIIKARKGRKEIEDNDPQLLLLTERRGVKHGDHIDRSQ